MMLARVPVLLLEAWGHALLLGDRVRALLLRALLLQTRVRALLLRALLLQA